MIIVSCFNQQNSKINGNVNKVERRRIRRRRRSFSVQSTFFLNLLNSSLKRQRNFLLTIWWCFLLHSASYPRRTGQLNTISEMATKMKGIYKGFKYTLSQIFVVKELKEREIEIGYPTDVKHVAHIGWDGPSGSAPSWMNQFKMGPDFSASSIGNPGSALSPWASQDYGESMMQQSGLDTPPTEHAPMKKKKKKQRRKKKASTSSPKSNSGSSSKSSRAAKAKTKVQFVDGNANQINIEVA